MELKDFRKVLVEEMKKSVEFIKSLGDKEITTKEES